MNTKLPISGAFTALVTPFTADGAGLDIEAFEALVQAQLDAGIQGLVPCGTTGESPNLSDKEQIDLVSRTAKLARGKVPVVAGTGSNSTHKTIRASQAALEAGADAVMLVMPYYNKPSQQGLFEHVTTVAREIGSAPIVLYNIPGRSVVDLATDTLARILDTAPNIAAVKDATGNVVRCQQVVHRFGANLSVMSGDDALTLGMMASGASGVISVTSNLYPDRVVAVCRDMREGNLEDARRKHFALLPVHEMLFVEPNPAPVKVGLAHRKRLTLSLRLPLAVPSKETQQRITKVLDTYEAGSAA